jgi:hypothetical protein
MSKINYFFYCIRWCGLGAYGRYKLVDDVTVHGMDSLHVKIITLNIW